MGHVEICQFIAKNYTDKNPSKEKNGWTPLHIAVINGHFEICRIIIENTDDPNPKSKYGTSALMIAAEEGITVNIPIAHLITEKLMQKMK